MKKQILTFIIGILIGAIITTTVFLVIKTNTGGKGNKLPSKDTNFQGGENGFTIPEGNNNKRTLNGQIEENDLNANEIEQ